MQKKDLLCGRSVRLVRRSLLLALALTLALALALAGCGGGGEPAQGNEGDAGEGDAPAASTDEVVTIKVNNFMPQETPPAKGTAEAAKKLEELSGGKMKADVYYSGTLLGFADSWQGCGDGAVDVAIIGPAVTDSNTLLNNIFETPVPNLPANNVRTTDMFNELIDTEPSLNEELATSNVRWLSLQSLCNSSLHMSTKIIRTPADVKGQKVEGLGAVSSKYWENVGATTSTLDPGEYYISCERGTVDGMFTHWPCVNDYKLNEVLKYHTIFGEIDPEYPSGNGLSAGCMGYIVNLDTWNRLTEEQQGWLQEAFRYGAKFSAEMDISSAKAGYDTAIAEGHEVVSITGDDLKPWVDAMQAVVDDWIARCEDAGLSTAKQVHATLLSLAEKYSQA
jgi:TRAP-type C4-dicarboxylate transport system substrate-binding protein